jgi:hypothetical protein
MHSSQAQQVVQTPLANGSRIGSSQAFDRMKARLLDRRARGKSRHIKLRRAWPVRLDGQQLITGIATCNPTVA